MNLSRLMWEIFFWLFLKEVDGSAKTKQHIEGIVIWISEKNY